MHITDDPKLYVPLTDFSTNPDPVQAGKSLTLNFTLANDTNQNIPCYEIAISLNPGDGPQNLCTDKDAMAATVTPPNPNKDWKVAVVKDDNKKPIVKLTPKSGKYLKAKSSLVFAVNVNVSGALNVDDLTQTAITITEYNSKTDNGVHQDIPLAKTAPATEFNSFAPAHVLVKQGQQTQLSWRCNPVGFERGKTSGKAYYTLEIDYDQLNGKPLDITALNTAGGGTYTGPGGGNDLALAHTTIFKLILTLWDKTGQTSSAHTQTALITVQNSDVDLGKLTVDYTANILRNPHLITTFGNHTATTDGLLLCTAQGSNSALVIKVTPPGGTQTTYQIKNSLYRHPEPSGSFTGNRILLPIPQKSDINISWPGSIGTYRAAWYPFGTGTLKPTT